jgi:hypothetical protein
MMERNLTIEQIREVLNDMDVPWAENIVDSIVAIRSAAYNEGWDDRDSGVGPDPKREEAPAREDDFSRTRTLTPTGLAELGEDDFSDPGFVVGAVHAQLEDLTDRERLIVIGDVLQDIAKHAAFRSADTDAIDQLVDFVRTPEWSVSMLEDIAVIVREARPDIGEEFDEDDDRAWRSH